MDFIKTHLRRVRRKHRIPRGLLVSASLAVAAVILTTVCLALPASAKMGMGMPRTENGVVTDGDGIIESGDMLPEGSDIMPDGSDVIPGGDESAEGESILPDVTESGTVESTTDTVSGTTATTTGNGTVADDAEEGTVLAWIVGLIILATVVIAIVLIVRWTMGGRRGR